MFIPVRRYLSYGFIFRIIQTAFSSLYGLFLKYFMNRWASLISSIVNIDQVSSLRLLFLKTTNLLIILSNQSMLCCGSTSFEKQNLKLFRNSQAIACLHNIRISFKSKVFMSSNGMLYSLFSLSFSSLAQLPSPSSLWIYKSLLYSSYKSQSAGFIKTLYSFSQ